MGAKRTLRDKLIYDVGMNDGADTAFYLHQGYNVVGIDADPTMVEAVRERFANEVRNGRLTLLNVGIAEKPGTALFWICEGFPEWNSFDRTLAAKDGKRHHSIEVRTVPFGDILDEYGVPHYLKIDIEGHDQFCVRALAGGPLPRYISTEHQPLRD